MDRLPVLAVTGALSKVKPTYIVVNNTMHPRGPYMPHILLLACQKPRRLFPPAEPRPRPPSRPGQRPCCRQYFSRGRHPLNPNDASRHASSQPQCALQARAQLSLSALPFPREEGAPNRVRSPPSPVRSAPPSSAHAAALHVELDAHNLLVACRAVERCCQGFHRRERLHCRLCHGRAAPSVEGCSRRWL